MPTMTGSEPTTITKKELVNRIADQTGQTKVVVKDILQKFLDEIIDELSQGNRLEFREFGVFEVRDRAARRAQNPRTLEKVQVPAKRVVKFKVGRMMKQRVSGSRSR
jgi:integration host factor subunit beta